MTTVTSLDDAPTRARGYTKRLTTFTRPADTTVYGTGDVISDSVATAKALVFPSVGDAGALLRVRVSIEENNGTPPALELWLFEDEPTNHLDNAQLELSSSDIAKLHGIYKLPAASVFIGNGSASPAGAIVYAPDTNAPNHSYRTESGSLYGLLVTRGTFTPASGTKIGVYIEILLDL